MNAKLDQLLTAQATSQAHLGDLNRKIAEQDSKLTKQDSKIAERDSKFAKYDPTTKALAENSDVIRMRFLNTYLRNINKGKVSTEGYQHINMGNSLAHDGAILLDKAL